MTGCIQSVRVSTIVIDVVADTFSLSHALNEEDSNNLSIMIQPTIMSYTFDVVPQPVLQLQGSPSSTTFLPDT